MDIKFILFLIVFCLFFIPTTLGVPPFTSSSPNGCEITEPTIQVLKQSSLSKMSFHVTNASNGVPLVNLVCSFHFYDNTGKSIYVNSTPIYDSEEGYTISLPSNILNTTGKYNYLFHCNNSQLGCFSANPISITPTGYKPDLEHTITHSLTIILTFCIFLFSVFGSVTIPWKNKTDENNKVLGASNIKYFKLVFIWFAYFSFMVLNLLVYSFMNTFEFYSGLARIFYLVYRIQLYSLVLLVPFTIFFGLITILTDKKLNDMVERNLKIR